MTFSFSVVEFTYYDIVIHTTIIMNHMYNTSDNDNHERVYCRIACISCKSPTDLLNNLHLDITYSSYKINVLIEARMRIFISEKEIRLLVRNTELDAHKPLTEFTCIQT